MQDCLKPPVIVNDESINSLLSNGESTISNVYVKPIPPPEIHLETLFNDDLRFNKLFPKRIQVKARHWTSCLELLFKIYLMEKRRSF